jgi:hypothetical protein
MLLATKRLLEKGRDLPRDEVSASEVSGMSATPRTSSSSDTEDLSAIFCKWKMEKDVVPVNIRKTNEGRGNDFTVIKIQ